THPYLVTARNTEAARSGVGNGVVAPELGVVLDPDIERARKVARAAIAPYFGLPNYTNNWLRSGYTEADLAHDGSDELIDDLAALGDVEAIARRVKDHLEAGADHVCLQVLDADADVIATLRALSTVA
ncbi:MAG TPA: LLM class F420-dependent oxidoreductase, partial [Kribbella sp.]